MPRTRVALLGAGAMGTIMARDIYPLVQEEAQVVAVVDRHPERRAPLAEALGAEHFGSLAEAMDSVALDAVDIRLQHSAHAAASTEALAAGLHILVEKPLATSAEECEQMIASATATSRVVAVSENYPHLPSVRAARRAIDDGIIGEPLTLRSTRAYTLEGVWAETTWRQGAGPIAGILWDQGTHHTSMLRALGGEVESVSAATSTGLHTPGAESVTLTLRMTSGLIAQSLYCWGTPAVDLETEAAVLGSTGRIDITVDYEGTRGGAVAVADNSLSELCRADGYYDSHRLIVLDWLAAIRDGGEPLVGLESAFQDVRVVLAAQQSLREGGDFVRVDRP